MITHAGELSKYAPPWKTCSRCGLTGPDVRDTTVGYQIGIVSRCSVEATCDAMMKGTTFGGPDWTGRAPAVPQLDAEEVASIAAVEHHANERAASESIATPEDIVGLDWSNE